VGILATQVTLDESEEKVRRKVLLKHSLPGLPPIFTNGLFCQALVKLGARVGVRPDECTHLVVKTLARTEKLLCAMAVAPAVITERWVRDSIAAKKLIRAWLLYFVLTPS
jgi:Regulator of Ty1 transposition protein 107 BRCT domain